MSAISVNNVTKAYKDNTVLRGVSFEVEKGTVYALLGSNGAGKTTTINILATLLSADGGEIRVAGYDVRTQPKKVRSQISLTGQYAAIDDLLTGEENMHMIGRLSRVSESTIKTRTADLLRQFGLEKAAKKRVSTYSGGMQRKLDLAISLLASPSIIFLDEPTTGLDPRSRQELWRVIRELAKGGTTILLTTQYLDEADYLADKIGVLNEGAIVAEGAAAELKRRVGAEFIELTFASEKDCVKAQRLIPGATVSDGSVCTLIAPVAEKLMGVRELLNELAAASLEPESMNIRKPTLDDVFMKLTEITDQEEKEK